MDTFNESNQPSLGNKLTKYYDRYVTDRIVLLTLPRWVFTSTLLVGFMFRVITKPGYFAIAYLLGFHILKNAINFVTPQGVPTIGEEEDDDEIELPTFVNSNAADFDEDAKPIMRKLTEFRLWEDINLPVIAAFVCSMFDLFDIPVFWPLLLFYFLYAMFAIVTRQRAHMQKYGYGLADFFKKNTRRVS